MATIPSFHLMLPDLEGEATKVKNLIINHLHNSNHINQEVYDDFILNYAVLVRRPSFFNRMWKKIMKVKEEENLQYVLVKQVSMSIPEETNDDNDNENKKSKVIPIQKKDE